MTLSAIFALFSFLNRYTDALGDLYDRIDDKHVLIPGAVMPDFVDVLGQSLLGFLIVCTLMIAAAVMHYAYHFHESKSIYTMRRLPRRWELHRRCLTLPAAGILLSTLAAFALLLLFYAAYMTLTPDICLTNGQWTKIWSVIV